MWIAKPTGDMTLSVLDETGFQIVKVDMLSYNTMKAGEDGRILTQTMNNLAIIAGFSCQKEIILNNDDLPFPDDGYSPTPWRLEYSNNKIVIRDGSKKRIADRTFGKSISETKINSIIDCISTGILILNQKGIQ